MGCTARSFRAQHECYTDRPMSLPIDPRDQDRPAPSEAGLGSPGIAEGEDDSLILWMLSLTPLQRLEAAQGFADSVIALRNGRRA